MVKKIRYFLRYYKILFHLLLGIGFCIISSPLSDLLCYLQKIPDESLFHTIYKIIIPIALFGLWILLLLTNIRDKTYLYKTGRRYGYDSTHYKRSYQELVTYFQDADPLRMNVADLPTMKWQDSGGLIFGKVGNKLLSFEPNKNGVVSMVWGAPGDGKTTANIITSSRTFGMKHVSGKLAQCGAVMVTDLKGDIYAANKDYRKIKRFSTINWKESAHYDPLVNARKMSVNDRAIFLENLAITIIPDDGSADSKYFTDGARDFFTGICLYLMNQNINISFPEIIQEIVIGNYSKWVIEIMKSSDLSAQAFTNHFYGENEKNVSGTYSKLVSSSRLFGTEIMQTLLRNDNNCISPNDLENCTDIYIQLDPNQMALYAPVISMIYQDFLSNALYRKIGQTPPIAYIIDEFGQIPAMPVIEQSAALLRAYNCSLLLSCQSLAMIEKHYGTAGRKLLMDCTKAHCFLSIMDPDTRDWASRLIGTKKCLKVSNSEQNKKDGTAGISVTETREKIYEPESFGNLPNEDAVIVYYKGKYIKAEKTYYFK
jgi:type IV secretory pathway TraG/TraD family ATPase VirD4